MSDGMDYADHMCHAALKAIRDGMPKEIALEAFGLFWDSTAKLEDIRHNTDLKKIHGTLK